MVVTTKKEERVTGVEGKRECRVKHSTLDTRPFSIEKGVIYMSNPPESASAELSIKDAIAADASTRFSFERTLLSHERTLMSWIRTSTSLITFGFTLYKFFQLELGGSARPGISPVISAREFAMIMISVGLVALILATIQNYLYRQHMRQQHLKIPVCLSSVVGALISFLGLLALLAAIFRW